MSRFSLKRLLAGVSMIAVGLGMNAYLAHLEPPTPQPTFPVVVLVAVCWFGGPALIGAGLLCPFRLTAIGAALGIGVRIITLLMTPTV